MNYPVPNKSVYIPKVFTDPDGVIHRGKDWGDLIAHVASYRRRNKLPEGEPEREVFEQVCNRNPDRCRWPDKKGKRKHKSALPLNKQILGWVSKLADEYDSLTFVSEEEASRRAAICATCPKQRSWKGMCKGCTGNVVDAEKAILKGRVPANVQGCAALGEDPAMGVWLEQPASSNLELPENCWRK